MEMVNGNEMTEEPSRLVVFIATPLEAEHVDRIRAVAPDRIEVIFEPDLLPPPRYVADHKGQDCFALNAQREERWREHLARAEILWDFPPASSDGTSGIDLAPNLKWIQTTSTGVGQYVKSLGIQESDILITTARGVHAGPLSEFVFLALLSHVKRLRHLEAEQKAHHWERFCGDELAGKDSGHRRFGHTRAQGGRRRALFWHAHRRAGARRLGPDGRATRNRPPVPRRRPA